MEPKFKVGDRLSNKHVTGIVKSIRAEYAYVMEGEEGRYLIPENELDYAKLSAEDAWLEVALVVGREIGELYYQVPPLTPNDAREIRHKAYQILGGNGLDCNAHHEEFKARINALIERAQRRG